MKFLMETPATLKTLLVTEPRGGYADLDAGGAGQGRRLATIWS